MSISLEQKRQLIRESSEHAKNYIAQLDREIESNESKKNSNIQGEEIVSGQAMPEMYADGKTDFQ